MKAFKIFTLLVLFLLTSCSGQVKQDDISNSGNSAINTQEIKHEVKVDTFLGINNTEKNNINNNANNSDNGVKKEENIQENKNNQEINNNTEEKNTDKESEVEDNEIISENNNIEDILLDTETLINTEIEEDKSLEELEGTTQEDIANLIDTLFEIEN